MLSRPEQQKNNEITTVVRTMREIELREEGLLSQGVSVRCRGREEEEEELTEEENV